MKLKIKIKIVYPSNEELKKLYRAVNEINRNKYREELEIEEDDKYMELDM